ncbi:hypothetical protein FQP90_10030 [Paenarthrobacter nitroguajacolicus]|uniref:DUF8094 domain-containing protein n=1 Tax=Paenarthrobacter nitroguajacolicus TaxID=211146 RepID=A0A558H2I2_PAENT|nr:hypothetical protein [Paenarthrobacter nitroguajacolicus]TVU63315.1 hypothetical protein FQP90_10030 [Paenarthrobacter nitroguajacolicus]
MIGDPVRLKTAALLVLLGLLTMLAGIGQLTFWAPAETVTASVPSDTKAAPLTVIDPKLIALHDGPVKIKIQGEGNFMVATGRPDDVEAWVGKTAHTTLSGVSADQKSLETASVDGEATAPSPAGSDLWVSTEDASGDLDYTWNPPADGEWSLLVAADGTQPAPSSISMTFPNNATTPWAVPLIVLGIIIILVGAALPFVAKALSNRRHDGEGDGPHDGGETTTLPVQTPASDAARRRGNETEGPALRVTALAAALAAVMVGGTAVAAQATTTPEPTTTSAAAAPAEGEDGTPVLLESQLQRILEQVASTVDAADAAKDAAKLAPRVDKMELQIRTQNYKIRSAVSAYEPRMPVRATKLQSSVISTKRDWPRTVFALTQGEGNVVPQVLTLVQLSPRENYKLWASAPLQPGTNFPSFPVPREGTEAVPAADNTGLAYSGNEALGILAEMLTTPDSPNRSKLADGQSSPYIAGALAYQADTVKNGTSANFKFTHTPVNNQTVVLRTADGGALVVGRLDFAFEGTPKAAGDKLLLEDDSAVFAGGKETTTGMVLNFAESVAVYIPPAGSTDPMKLVAATRGLVGASFK